ncbi:MAG: hypothetical protein KAR33_04480 [Candidatus Thorarchaeota archaeon]|nr:hypothetical protein [Candidatus Thorarchaeota archaeon]
MRRVITISRKKWGKSAAKTEKIIRDAIPKPETLSEIDQYLEKSRSVTPYDLANRFGIRMSVAKKILKEKEQDGTVVAYIRESGFVVYSTPSELEKRDVGGAALVTAAIEEIAKLAPTEAPIDPDMESALAAASSAGTIVKSSKLARKRREAGDKKERKDTLPEVVIEPLAGTPEAEPEPKEAKPKKTTKKAKEAKPKKTTKKAAEDKPKKVIKKTTKKAAAEKPKKTTKKTTKKAAEEKPKKTAKKTTKKAAEEKPKKTTKKTTKKAAEEKPKKKTTKKTTKKAAEEKPKKKTTKK